MSIAGAITRADVEGKFTAMFGLTGAAQALPLVPPPQPREARVVFSDTPGASQSTIIMWAPTPGLSDPDATATEVMSAVLGGDSVQSRLARSFARWRA